MGYPLYEEDFTFNYKRREPPPKGWYSLEGGWYLTFGALKEELQIKPKKKLLEYLKEKNPETQTLENPHNHRPFTVYNAEDLGIDRNPNYKERVY